MCKLEDEVTEAKDDIKWVRSHMALKTDFTALALKVDGLAGMVNVNSGKTDTMMGIVLGKMLEGGVVGVLVLVIMKVGGI